MVREHHACVYPQKGEFSRGHYEIVNIVLIPSHPAGDYYSNYISVGEGSALNSKTDADWEGNSSNVRPTAVQLGWGNWHATSLLPCEISDVRTEAIWDKSLFQSAQCGTIGLWFNVLLSALSPLGSSMSAPADRNSHYVAGCFRNEVAPRIGFSLSLWAYHWFTHGK